eukprot:15365549-Ditylum_brightwellii.AAC.1
MDRPHNATELRMFISCVNYYQDMLSSRAHILKPITNMSSLPKKAPLDWTPACDTTFNKVHYLMAADDLAA